MNITPDTPEQARQRRFEAQARTGKGTCGHVADKSNLRSLKDGRVLCPPCMTELLEELFADIDQDGRR
jgi:hypothetical protein